MQYESAESLLAEIQMDLGMTSERESSRILRWMYRGLQRLGVAYTNVTSCKQKIKNLSFDKPEDYVGLSHIYLGKNCIEPKYADVISCCPVNKVKCDHRYFVSEGLDQFNLNDAGREFEYAEIIYYSIPIEDGLPMIPGYAIHFIKKWVNYQNAMWHRNRSRGGSSRMNPVPVSEIDYLENSMNIALREAFGIQNAPNGFQQARQVGETMIFTRNDYPSHYRNFKTFLR